MLYQFKRVNLGGMPGRVCAWKGGSVSSLSAFRHRSTTDDESQCQTQFSGRLDIIPEPLQGSGHDLQPLVQRFLYRLSPSKTVHQQRSLWCELRC